MNDSDQLAKALGPEVVGMLIHILRQPRMAHVHLHVGPVRNGAREIVAELTHTLKATGLGDSICIDENTRTA